MSADYIPSDFGDLSGTVAASQLPASGVTPGTYPLATVTVDTHGRVTVASAGSISTADVSGLAAALAATASDSAVVHLAGMETITGAKTFSTPVSVTTGNSLTSPTINIGTPNDGIGYYSGNLLVFESGKLSLVLTDALRSFRVPSDYIYSWASSTDNLTSSDTGFSRFSAGVIYLGSSNGSSNALILGAPTAGTTALTVQAASGQTAPLVSLRGVSSTGTARDLGYLDAGFTVATDASYIGFVTLSARDHAGTGEGLRITQSTIPAIGFLGSAGTTRQPITGDTTTDLAALQAVVKQIAQRLDVFGLVTDSTT